MSTTRVTSVKDEIRQTKPFKTARQEALVALLRTSDELRRFLTETVQPAGITLQQYNGLRILRGAGGRALPTLEVAERMIERTPGVTRLIDRLADNGWVERHRCGEDRRRVLCSITDEGLALLESLDDEVEASDRAALGGLSDDDVARLTELLDRMRAELRRSRED